MEGHTELFAICECHDPGHVMNFCLDVGEPVTELYVSVQLNQQYGFCSRLWLALKYVAGKRSRFGSGHWDSGSISPESASELISLLNRFLESRRQTVTVDNTASTGWTSSTTLYVDDEI